MVEREVCQSGEQEEISGHELRKLVVGENEDLKTSAVGVGGRERSIGQRCVVQLEVHQQWQRKFRNGRQGIVGKNKRRQRREVVYLSEITY